ncbi:MAG TPA: D-alanyl-D-alanine carboxypeptidase/D-alanyl-D-alanine-endopeptidase [Tepidisphaeraceae bacterium]
MKHSLRLFVIVLMLAPIARADLASDVHAVLGDKLLNKGDVGVEIIRLGASLDDAKAIYESKATTPRIPASNLKVVTTSTALEKLGTDFQFKTIFASRGNDIALIGDGDPSLGDAEMLRKSGWDVDTVFKNWAQMLQKRGITQVHDVFVDDSIFDQNFTHPDWPVDQLHKNYCAQVGGVNLNTNCLDFYLRTTGFGNVVQYITDPPTRFASIKNSCVMGQKNAVWLSRQPDTNDIVLRGETNTSNDEPISVTINDPPMFAATVLCETLAANGVKVTGKVERDRTIRNSLEKSDGTWSALAVHTTPLSTIITRANKDSMNLYAESLCKRIGAAATGQSGSWENGTAATAAFLESLGVAKDEFTLDDGCGLSKKNAISPNAMAKVLEHDFYGRQHDIFMSSLAIAGVDGTFETRFRDSDLRGRVFGKSGYVVGVSSLSGYLKTKDGQWYVFSILMNGLPSGTNNSAKILQEKIVKAIDAQSAGYASDR